GPLLLGRYRALGETFYNEDKALATRRAAWAYGLSLIGTFAFYGCYAAMAMLAATGKLSLGNLTLYVVAFRQGQQAFQSILQAVGGMYEDNLYMSNLWKYLAIETHAPRDSVPELPAATDEGIRFENVGFRYAGREEWALRGIHLH